MATHDLDMMATRFDMVIEQALGTSLGIELRVSDVPRAIAQLHAARRRARAPKAVTLHIDTSPWPERSDLVVWKAPPESRPLARMHRALAEARPGALGPLDRLENLDL